MAIGIPDYKIKKTKPKPSKGMDKVYRPDRDGPKRPAKPGNGIKYPQPIKPGKPTRPGDSIVKPTAVKPGAGSTPKRPKPRPTTKELPAGMVKNPATDAQKRAKKLKTLEDQLKKSKGGGIGGGGKKVKRATGMVKTTKTMRKGTR
jgi:hypothetical protein